MINTEEPGKKEPFLSCLLPCKNFLLFFLLGQFRQLFLKEHLFLQLLDLFGLVNISASVGFKKCDYREL